MKETLSQYERARERAMGEYVTLMQTHRNIQQNLWRSAQNLIYRPPQVRATELPLVIPKSEHLKALRERDEQIAELELKLNEVQKRYLKRTLQNPYAWLGATGQEDEY